MLNAWEDELHNDVQMNFGSNLPFSAQELNTKPRDGFSLWVIPHTIWPHDITLEILSSVDLDSVHPCLWIELWSLTSHLSQAFQCQGHRHFSKDLHIVHSSAVPVEDFTELKLKMWLKLCCLFSFRQLKLNLDIAHNCIVCFFGGYHTRENTL